MNESKPASTPLAIGTKLTKGSDGSGDEEKFPFRELVIGALMSAALGTRQDIAHAVSTLGQFSSNPEQEHWSAAKRVLRYIQGTTNLGLNPKIQKGQRRLEMLCRCRLGQLCHR